MVNAGTMVTAEEEGVVDLVMGAEEALDPSRGFGEFYLAIESCNGNSCKSTLFTCK